MCKIDILFYRCKDSASRMQKVRFLLRRSLFSRGDFLKSPAKVVLFAHTAKQIAQNRLFCAHFGDFVQSYNSKKQKLSFSILSMTCGKYFISS